jgi:hypothetical protein
MFKNIIALFSFLLFSLSVEAQIKKFDKKFGYFEYELVPMQQIVDSQNNHIVAGMFRGVHKINNTTIQSKGDADIFMIKYNASNNIEWIKTFGSSAGESIVSLSCDKDGNILFTGSFNGTAFFTSPNDSLQVIPIYSQSRYVVKLNPSGSVNWAKRFSGTISGPADKSEVFADHQGRVYLIHTGRANGTLNSWQFQDSTILNPANPYLNVPRWMMMRLDENTGDLKWLNYIANPSRGSNIITYLTISRPVVDSRNYINFVATYDGLNVDPIYIFGQYVQNGILNPRVNNVLFKIDSLGTVNRLRDMGEGNTNVSDPSELAINQNDELVLINKKASGSENGITYNYVSNPLGINYARVYDSTFSLLKIIQLGNQSIGSFAFDKHNKLITLGTTSTSNYNVNPVNESIKVDSTKSVTFNTQSQVFPYYIRYNHQFKSDTFFLENKSKPLVPISINWNALRIAKNGNIVPSLLFGTMNNLRFRYDSLFNPVNANYGKQRDKEDPIISLIEDDRQNIYTIGVIQAKTVFTKSSGQDSLMIPYENGSDAFISKYDSLGNLVWIKTFSSTSNEQIKYLKKTKTGLIFVVESIGQGVYTYDNTIQISGRSNLIKVDFDGNFLWSKAITSQISGANPTPNILKTLNNGNILLGVNIYNDFYYGGQKINRLGGRPGQTILIINDADGSILKENRFALRDESFSFFSNVLSNAHEDNRGNLYFSCQSSINNLNSPATTNELYSRKSNTVSFTHTWVYQTGLLKLDSNLEIRSLKQFMSYSYLFDIAGQNDKIYIAGIGRNKQFNFGDTTINLHNYAEQKHFTSYLAVLDTNLRFNKIMKYDTTINDVQIVSSIRKILINKETKDVYQTAQFVGKLKIDSSVNEITSLGGYDMLFLKYDSLGNFRGGQKLGTPQNDFFLDAIINKKGNLVFASQAVDPNYNSTIIFKNTGTNSSNGLSGSNDLASLPVERYKTNSIKASNTNTETGIDKNVLTPDNYLSQYSSLREIGYNPDTSLDVTKSLFCIGDSAILMVNEVSDIKWKKNNSFLQGETSMILKPKTTGKYKAILTTVDNRIDSTREVEIMVDNIPTPTINNVNYCIGAASNVLSATVTSGNALKWYGNNLTGGIGNNIAPTPSTTTVGTSDYYVTQISNTTGCESERAKLIVTVNPIPTTPFITRDINNNLVSSAKYGNQWYLDGVLLNDTLEKLKPSIFGNYTLKNIQTGCTSALSTSYFYLFTDLLQFGNNQFIKIAPNPFVNHLYLDFFINGFQKLNVEIFELSTGKKVLSKASLLSGSLINTGNMASGTYLIIITSLDNKLNYQFKAIKF